MTVAANPEPLLSMGAVDADRRRKIMAMHNQAVEAPMAQEAPELPDGVENLCPFGCKNDKLNEIGHCRHLVGFSSNGKTFEPQVKRKRPAREADGKIIRDDDKNVVMEWDGAWITDGRNPQIVLKTDKLVTSAIRPGVSKRVYRRDADTSRGVFTGAPDDPDDDDDDEADTPTITKGTEPALK